MLYKVVLTFESEGKILKGDHSNESYWALLSCGAVYYTVQFGANFRALEWNPEVRSFILPRYRRNWKYTVQANW